MPRTAWVIYTLKSRYYGLKSPAGLPGWKGLGLLRSLLVTVGRGTLGITVSQMDLTGSEADLSWEQGFVI